MHALWTKEEVKWDVGLPLMAHCINEALMESLNTHTHKEGDTLLLAYMKIEASIT